MVWLLIPLLFISLAISSADISNNYINHKFFQTFWCLQPEIIQQLSIRAHLAQCGGYLFIRSQWSPLRCSCVLLIHYNLLSLSLSLAHAAILPCFLTNRLTRCQINSKDIAPSFKWQVFRHHLQTIVLHKRPLVVFLFVQQSALPLHASSSWRQYSYGLSELILTLLSLHVIIVY